MAFEVITTNQTDTYTVNNSDNVTLMPGVTLTDSLKGFVADSGGSGIFSNAKLSILGTVVSSYMGVDFYFTVSQVDNVTVVIGTTGQIHADDDGVAFDSGDNNSIINNGLVTFGDYGLYFEGGTGNVIENHGTILAVKSTSVLPVNAIFLGLSGSATFVNTGLVSGTVLQGLVQNYGANSTTFNSGQLIAINGDAFRSTNGGIDTFTNTGSIRGDVRLGAGADTFTNLGGTLDGTVFGGDGDDTFIVDDALISLVEATDEGTDLVISSTDHTLGDNFENLTLAGPDNIDGIGNGKDNTIIGNASDNRLRGKDGVDHISGKDGDDRLFGGKGDDTLSGGDGDDFLSGGRGNDTLNGGGDADRLRGGRHDDTLKGGEGNDVLIGGLGTDVLTGGNGKDDFVFNRKGDSLRGNPSDTITDFAIGEDRIDLSGLQPDQKYIGSGGFSGTMGEVQVRTTGGVDNIIKVDVDGDGAWDMKILVQGVTTLSEVDFIL